MIQQPLMRRTVMLPLSSGQSALKEKRKDVTHDLDLSQSATQVGDWNHPASDTMLLDSDAVPHVNNANDPGSSTLNMSDTLAFNMERVRGIEDTISFADTVHASLDGIGSGLPLQYELTANETINVGQPVYVSAADTVNLADADALNTSHVLGLAVTDATANSAVLVYSDGKVERSDWTAIVGTANLVAGAVYYLSTTAGQLTTTPPTGDGDHVVRCGVAINATTIDIEINEVAIL
jgi:hypothetical protein